MSTATLFFLWGNMNKYTSVVPRAPHRLTKCISTAWVMTERTHWHSKWFLFLEVKFETRLSQFLQPTVIRESVKPLQCLCQELPLSNLADKRQLCWSSTENNCWVIIKLLCVRYHLLDPSMVRYEMLALPVKHIDQFNGRPISICKECTAVWSRFAKISAVLKLH